MTDSKGGKNSVSYEYPSFMVFKDTNFAFPRQDKPRLKVALPFIVCLFQHSFTVGTTFTAHVNASVQQRCRELPLAAQKQKQFLHTSAC